MATEPIVIYSHRVDPQGVLQVLKLVAADVALEGTPKHWTKVICYGPKQFLRKRINLHIGHDPSCYLAQNWNRQLSGMAEYFQGFAEIPRKPEILRTIYGFQFLLTLVENTDLDPDVQDIRMEWVFAIVKHLDGIIFTPTALRDASGRLLISSWGEFDEAAVLPEFIPTDDEVRDQTAIVPVIINEDKDVDPEPPNVQRVVNRAFVLTAISQRGIIEDECRNHGGDKRDGEKIRIETCEWLKSLRIDEEIEPSEWKILQRKVGTLEPQSMLNSIWRMEGLAVLAWALQIAEIPNYDELCDSTGLALSLGYLETRKSLQIRGTVSLRTSAQLDVVNKQLLALHWRVRNFRLRPEQMNFVEFSKNCWFGSFDLQSFRILENDLAIGSEPIVRCNADLLQRTSSAVMERHLASNWLQGSSRIYSETDTST